MYTSHQIMLHPYRAEFVKNFQYALSECTTEDYSFELGDVMREIKLLAAI